LQGNEPSLSHAAVNVQTTPVPRLTEIFDIPVEMAGPEVRAAGLLAMGARDIHGGDTALLSHPVPRLDAGMPATSGINTRV
jgi:hypothetical protein